jgi:hypothetical protein
MPSNRMRSIVQNLRSQFSLFYHDRPPFPLTPHVFGCAFVHILDPGQDKLSPWTRKCVFLGYSPIQRVIVL